MTTDIKSIQFDSFNEIQLLENVISYSFLLAIIFTSPIKPTSLGMSFISPWIFSAKSFAMIKLSPLPPSSSVPYF
ncbi:MAG TPA: hypothetical protein PLP33_11595 [Leptospiraceae bacterium]|nr:hypothetical protein [Leptospiraceae bacterium]HNA07690.1 hypothetical protein [Leptospiraceae bacterium]HNC56080.1 hypothetical protein [Leptospiraceae bacterium]HNL72317.1 hypothetical protein [Leptospiraceae bacterium]